MGNATKVALVALLILMVVVVARFVREDTAVPEPEVAARKPLQTAGRPAAGGPESVARSKVLPGSTPSSGAVSPGGVAAAGGARIVPAQARVVPRSSGSGGPSPAPGDPAGSGPSALVATGFPPLASPRGQSPAGGGPTSAGGQTGASPAGPSTSPVGAGQVASPGAGSAGSTTPAGPESPAGPGSHAQEGPGNRPPPLAHLSDGTKVGGAPRKDDTSATAVLVQEPGRAPGDPLVSSQLQPRDRQGGFAPALGPGTAGPLPASAREKEDGRPSLADLVRGLDAPGRAPKDEAGRDGPGGEPAPAGETNRGSYPRTHVIAKGDTLWRLAETYYGNGALARVIEKENPGVKIQPGRKLVIPQPPEGAARTGKSAAKSASSPPPAVKPGPGPKDYVVQSGDTLGVIAKKFFGDASKVHLIEEANPGLRLQYQMLRAGARIRIPSKE